MRTLGTVSALEDCMDTDMIDPNTGLPLTPDQVAALEEIADLRAAEWSAEIDADIAAYAATLDAE